MLGFQKRPKRLLRIFCLIFVSLSRISCFDFSSGCESSAAETIPWADGIFLFFFFRNRVSKHLPSVPWKHLDCVFVVLTSFYIPSTIRNDSLSRVLTLHLVIERFFCLTKNTIYTNLKRHSPDGAPIIPSCCLKSDQAFHSICHLEKSWMTFRRFIL